MIILFKKTQKNTSIISKESFHDKMKGSKFSLIKDKNDYLIISRDRIIPSRGVFRLLIPVMKVKVVFNSQKLTYKIKLDGLALFFIIMLLGGIIVELTMDRKLYPREYPPEFIYGLFAFYVVLIVFEIRNTVKKLNTFS